jgi:nitroreductase
MPEKIVANSRVSSYAINPLFLERWSPRAFTDEAISDTQLLTLFEAARWAPSSFNSQPWRFLYAKRDTEHWPLFLSLLVEFNQSWAKNAAALIIVISKKTAVPPGATAEVASYSHSFDTGAAWAQLALQATASGWVAHGMIGFNKDRAAVELQVPENFRVEAAIAIGRRGDKSVLPERLQGREVPSDRLPLEQIVFRGGFKTS